jgi:hypothetical protein
MSSIYNEYEKWLGSSEIDDVMREELVSIKNNEEELKLRFSSPLSFGTAGLRGIMGVGIGKNCKIADAAAAEAALEKLKAQESESKEVSAPMRDGASKLRSFCSKNKLGAPIFTDLGEQEGSDDYAKMYEFECAVKDIKITKKFMQIGCINIKHIYHRPQYNICNNQSQ